jgi:signal transduction histidine kinase
MKTIKYIFERTESKKNDYKVYDFSGKENDALKTFFDLAQEFDAIEDFYNLCVAIPKSFFDKDACLYFIDPDNSGLNQIARTSDCKCELSFPPSSYIEPEEHRKLFFQKYANRIGFNLHNRFLVEKNIEHLKFIKTLVADIEHNIIVPNMVYKLFLRGLRRKIEKNIELEGDFVDKSIAGQCDDICMTNYLKELTDINQGLSSELENIEKHYKNMSLFIETLFRKSHFDQGRLIPRTKQCNMKKDVVQPQLDRYMEQMKRMGIEIDDQFSGIPDAEVITVVDIGLMAQVFANLFSNAVKYTQEITTHSGEKKKYLSYGHETIKDYFGEGRDGVKYNVFSSGPHIVENERSKLFEEEYRASNVLNQPGTGHGLSFIKNAVEIHGGIAGYEPTEYGNNFYFILPI